MDKIPIHIRLATSDDLPHIKGCLVESWVEHAKNVPDLLDEERMRNSDIETYYTKALKSSENIILVAEVDGKFAGFIRGNIEDISGFFKSNHILFLDDVCVLPVFRKRGIARKLVCEIEKIAKERGITRLQGRVYTFNVQAQGLFRKLGYGMPHSTWDKLLE